MSNIQILKRLYKDYTKKFLNKIFLAVFFSILVAISTSATAWLLDPAIEKIFLNKDQTLIFVIPILIIIAFSTKGISLYIAKTLMIKVAEEVKKKLQIYPKDKITLNYKLTLKKSSTSWIKIKLKILLFPFLLSFQFIVL